MNKEFDSDPVYGNSDKYIKAKIKLFGDKLDAYFQSKKIPKENTSYKCLSLIMLDSVIRVNKKYYALTHLEESKYEIKMNKMETLIMMFQSKLHLIMNLIMNLMTMNVMMVNLMINLLKIKTVFLILQLCFSHTLLNPKYLCILIRLR